jgi:hypothetical protein
MTLDLLLQGYLIGHSMFSEWGSKTRLQISARDDLKARVNANAYIVLATSETTSRTFRSSVPVPARHRLDLPCRLLDQS